MGNSASTKPSKLLLRVVRNKSKNSKLACAKSRTNLTLNNAVPLILSRPTERWNAELRKLLTKARKTRRIFLEFKTLLTNFKLRSRLTNVKKKNFVRNYYVTSTHTQNLFRRETIHILC